MDDGPILRRPRRRQGQYAMNHCRVDLHTSPAALRVCLSAVGLAVSIVCCMDAAAVDGPAAESRGWQALLTRAYLPSDLDQEVFDDLWTTWEEPARSRAERAPLEERRRMAMERYGLTPHPDDPSRSLQYVVDDAGRWTMSCLACHQGQVDGRVIPGLPNSNYALETLTEEVRLVKVRQRKAFGHMDMGSLFLPLGTTNGTTNAVMFGVALMRHRAPDLSIVQRPPRLDLVHHDMDAPPWWHYRKRKSLYADGFAPQGHRMLMQFLLVKENGPEKFREWEEEFRDIEAWIESLERPRWPWAVDAELAARGRTAFEAHCASCHGTYGPGGTYPDRIVAIDEVGTDRVRFDALSTRERSDLNTSWFGHFGKGWGDETAALQGRETPAGYVAPPLDGIWATAPYFHNGSVPTLWHVLHPATRPVLWKRTPTGYDQTRVGLEVKEFTALPRTASGHPLPPAERRRHFDTSKPGKSAAGHDFVDALDEAEKAAVLEFLKTL
jgi:mono/diheme cytochrome c family protein